MKKYHYIFLLKGNTVVPQSLDEQDAAEIIRTLLSQSFNVSHVHALAEDNNKALEKFDKVNRLYVGNKVREVVIC